MTTSRIFSVLFLSLLIFIMFFHPLYAITSDLGRHILLGQIIVQTHIVPQTNLLSYTNPDYPFINTHWFSEVMFYVAQNLTGFFGLLLFTTAIATAALVIQLLYVRKHNPIAIILATILYLRILLERTDVRPEIFSFLFLSIFIVVLYKYRTGFTRWIYILPAVELIWVNTHIYFPVGVGVTGLFLLDRLITQRKKIKHTDTIALAGVLIASIIATLFNPNTIQEALFPLNVFQNYGFSVEENYSVFTIWQLLQQKSTILFFFISVLLLFLVMLIRVKKTKPVDWFLALFFTAFAASVERNLPLFIFTTFIPFTESLDDIYKKFYNQVKGSRNLTIAVYIIVGCFIALQTKDIVNVKAFGYDMPVGASHALDFVEKNNISGPIFNNFDIGSYIAYRMYPKEKVFVDGRPEAYPVSFFNDTYIPMQQDKSKFAEVDKKYHFNVIIFSHTDPTPWAQKFLLETIANSNWRLVYVDSLMVVLVKNTPENQHITKYTILNSPEFSQSKLTKDQLIKLLLFYQNIGWTNEMKQVDQKLLEMDPKYCYALLNLAQLLQNENDPAYVVYATKYQNGCL